MSDICAYFGFLMFEALCHIRSGSNKECRQRQKEHLLAANKRFRTFAHQKAQLQRKICRNCHGLEVQTINMQKEPNH